MTTINLVQLAVATSSSSPMHDQSFRSSGDFSTQAQSSSITGYLWTITGAGASDITFDVAEDVSAGKDKTIFTNLKNNSFTQITDLTRLYLGNPQNATSDFVVTVQGISVPS